MRGATEIDLAQLQADALAVSGQHASLLACSAWAGELAGSRRFAVLGRGTSRLGIELPGGRVAKVAHCLTGLVMNLHEMAVWMAQSEGCRRHLAPCLDLSPELVLTQGRVEPLGPPLVGAEDPGDPEWGSAHMAAREQHADAIYACRAGCGLDTHEPPEELRPDNFGLYEGRVVAIDYGDQFPALPLVWEWLLGEAQPTVGELAKRAGMTTENTDGASALLLEAARYVDVGDFLDRVTDRQPTALVASD